MQIILIMSFEMYYRYYEYYINHVITGWLKSIGSWLYASLTTGSLFATSSPSNISWGNCR